VKLNLPVFTWDPSRRVC